MNDVRDEIQKLQVIAMMQATDRMLAEWRKEMQKIDSAPPKPPRIWRTKAWWRSQAEHRFTLLRANIAARNRYWRWLGNCWDRAARLDAEILRLQEDIEAKEHLLVEREARIAELEETIEELKNLQEASHEARWAAQWND